MDQNNQNLDNTNVQQPQMQPQQPEQPQVNQGPQPQMQQPQPQMQQPQPQMQQQYQQPMYQQPMPQQIIVNQGPAIPEEYKPISAWGYVGYFILFGIPLVGFILMLVFAFGGNRNINVRNFARSFLCLMLLGLIITAFIFIIFGGLLGAFGR